jgi:glycosyltransferase involved in cell wall biosynthesis
MKASLVSVIIPVFNAERYVGEAIRSVLSQTYRAIELICVNDGSTDGSLSILQSFKTKIVLIDNEENCGTAESRNRGIHEARGEFLAFIDNDDIWESNKLEVQMDQFQNRHDLDVSLTYMQCFISPEISEDIKDLRYCPADPLPGYIPSTMVARRISFDKVGYFDSRWKNGESFAWIVRANEVGLKVEVIEDVLVRRRIHDNNKSVSGSSTSRSDYLRILRESVDRRTKQ